MAHIRYNEATQVWEKAVNPDVAVKTWNHLPIATPTLPSDTVNKAYVDAALGGGGFVPYTGAVNDVNLGIHKLVATGLISTSSVYSNVPALGSFTGVTFGVLSTNNLFGLAFGISSLGHAWIQQQRFDGTTAVYDLYLQYQGGHVGIGPSGNSAVLNIGDTGDKWTANGWGKAIELPTITVIKWNTSGSHYFGIGQSGDTLYFVRATVNDNSAAVAQYPLSIGPDDIVHVPAGIQERTYTVPMGIWQAWTPTWQCYGNTANGVIGNGSLYARFSIVGKTCSYKIQLVIGSTTVMPASYWAFLLPFPAVDSVILGSGFLYKGATGELRIVTLVPGAYFFGNPSTIGMISGNAANTSDSFVYAAYPWTWVAGDTMFISGQYEMQ